MEIRSAGNISNHLSNNTEFISTILELAESSGKTVRILSPNRMMANDINENIRRKPNNLWRWLLSLGKSELGESVAGFKYRYKAEIDLPLLRFRQGKDVIVVNDIGTLGCNDMCSLLELTEKTNAKVIFLQDLNNTKKGYGPGNSTETLKQAGIETFKIDTVKKAGKNIEKLKNTAKAFNYVSELKEVKDNNERTNQLAKIYILKEDSKGNSKEDKSRNNTVVLVGSKGQLKLTNEAIRKELKNQGKLSGIEHAVSVLEPIYMSKPEVTLAHKYQKNMIIRFYDTKYMGKDWKVENIDRERNILRLVQEGKKGKDSKDAEENKSIKDKGVKKGRSSKRILWNPKKQEINHKVYQKINHAVFKKETIQIAKGDKLIATGNMHFLGIRSASKFIVQDINGKHMKLVRPLSLSDRKGAKKTKEIKVRLRDLKNSHFQYDYATTISRYSRKKVEHVLVDIKAYSLDKATINEITSYAQKSLTIFTNDANIEQRRFSHVPVKLTAAETLLYASEGIEITDEVKGDVQDTSKVDRFINDKTLLEVKSDIERAIAVLRSQYEVRNRAENRSVEFALEKITSRNAGFIHKDLVKEALEYSIVEQIAVQNRKVTREDIERVIKEKQISGELIMGRYFEDGTRWTTRKIREQELSIVEKVKKGKNKLDPLLDKKTAENLLELRSEKNKTNERSERGEKSEKNGKSENINLTQDQSNACYVITTTKDQFVMVQGDAGTGKTTMFGYVQEMLKKADRANGEDRKSGEKNEKEDLEKEDLEKEERDIKKGIEKDKKGSIEILALAPTHQAVKELRSKGLEAQTFKSFLVEWQRVRRKEDANENRNISQNKDLIPSTNKQLSLSSNNSAYVADDTVAAFANVVNAGISKQETVSLDNKLIVLDEASMVSNEDFSQFLEIVVNGRSHIVLSGDIKQHLSIC